jgi:hypothetical protein
VNVAELERALTMLGRELEVPETPDLRHGVLARIEPRRERARAWGRRPQRRRRLVAVAVALLAALTATLAIPDARSALFRFLTIGGERIELVDELPAVPVEHDLELTLGNQVTLEEARRRSEFGVRELETDPDRVYLGDRGTVWFLYGSPASPRLLLAQTPLAFLDEQLILKKLASPETSVEQVDVDGSPGYFLSGAAHVVFLLDESGQIIDESARLARDVLVWEQDGVAYRLEGELSREDALELAAELR